MPESKARNRSGFQFLDAIGDDGYNDDNSNFGAAVIDFQKKTESGTRWRLTLAPNPSVGAVIESALAPYKLGLSYLFDLNTTCKVEYRRDRANLPVFENVKDGSYEKSNSLFGASVLVSF